MGIQRSEIVDLLQQLGVADDQAALSAARELDRRIREAGLNWDDLLSDETIGATDEEAPAEDDGPAERSESVHAGDAPRILDRLLARKNLSPELREELRRLKADVAAGEFDAADRQYVRALAKRLEG